MPSHLLRASANSFDLPGMWDTSTSTFALDMSRLNFSRKKAIGIWVENNLLVNDSAVVLSDNIGILMGMREPGKNFVAMNTNASWAKVSRQPMSFCKSSCIGI